MKIRPGIVLLVSFLFLAPACSESSSEAPATPDTFGAEDGSSDTSVDDALDADAQGEPDALNSFFESYPTYGSIPQL